MDPEIQSILDSKHDQPVELPKYVPMVHETIRDYCQESYDAYTTKFQLPNGDISEVFSKLLKDTGAILAGGFLLKAIEVKPYTMDMDIYVSCKNLPQLNTALAKMLGYNVMNETMASVYCRSFLRKNGIRSVQTYSNRNSTINMDIMAVRNKRSPVDVVQNFDLTFCQIWYDGTMVYATHPEHIKKKIGYLQKDYVSLYLSGNRFLLNRCKRYERVFQIYLEPIDSVFTINTKELFTIKENDEPRVLKETEEWQMKWCHSALVEYIITGKYTLRSYYMSGRYKEFSAPTCTETGRRKIFRKVINDERPEIGLDIAALPMNPENQNNRNPPRIQRQHFAEENDIDELINQLDLLREQGAPQNEIDNLVRRIQNLEEPEFNRRFQDGGKYIDPPYGTTDGYDSEDYDPPETIKLHDLAKQHAAKHNPDFASLDGETAFYHIGRLFIEDCMTTDAKRNIFRGYNLENIREEQLDHWFDPFARYPESWVKYVRYLSKFMERKGDDFFGEEDKVLYDFHDHPLEAGISRESLESYLKTKMSVEDKNTVPCFWEGQGCNHPLTLNQVRPCVSYSFFIKYRDSGLTTEIGPLTNAVNTLAFQYLENTATTSDSWGELYHSVVCPFCLIPDERTSGCAYMKHPNPTNKSYKFSPFCKEVNQVPEIYKKYSEAANNLRNEFYNPREEPKLEYCVECGRPCVNHTHFDLNDIPGLAPHKVIRGADEIPDYGVCDGGGRAEFFARILAIRQVLYETPDKPIEGEEEDERVERLKKIRAKAAIAADAAPKNNELMERAKQILEMNPSERKWKNALEAASVAEAPAGIPRANEQQGGKRHPCPHCTKKQRSNFRSTRKHRK